MADQTKMQMDEERNRMEEEDKRQTEEEFMKKHREQRKSGRETGGELSKSYSTSSMAETESESEVRKRSRAEKESPDRLKRKKLDGEEEEEVEQFGDDPLKNIGIGMDLLVQWFRQPSLNKLVTKPQQKKFTRIVSVIQEQVVRCREEKVRRETRQEERGSLVEIIREVVREESGKKADQPEAGASKSFAAVVGTREVSRVPKVTGAKGPVMPAPKLVIIKHDDKESEEVEATLKKLVKPSEIGLRVKRLTSIRNGVIVEADDNVGAENLLQHEGLKKAGMKVGKPAKKNPVVMIYDVSKDLNDTNIREEVFTKNMDGSGIAKEDFPKEFDVRHRHKDIRSGGKKCHIVVECSVRVRNWLRARERLFIEWQSCRIKDYVDLARCYKCQRFGHVAKHCSSKKSDCSRCAGDHDYKDCPNKTKEDKKCCVNCKRDGHGDTKHEASWRRCPVYERAAKRHNERIDYGL